MSSKEIAINILDELSEEQIKAFITLFASESMQARIETEQIISDPNSKRFDTLEEMKKDMLSE